MLLGLLCSSSLTFYYLGILQHLQFPLSQAMMELHIHSGCIVLITGIHERTFIAIKPDGVQRRLVGEIIRRFEQKGFKLIGMKILQVWQGLDVVKITRAMMGETNPADSAPGTIRGDFCVEVGRNVIHGSDSVASAVREISLWFQPEELICWNDCTADWIYE
ncbi:nucleoside diphosphate kinase 3 isoform X4 [Stegostoma tigrinum]|uniref:nucleoside diphosphate kinase 3 isoform X4 n=1 Tax=Stegostoma tigrinum TaxID=3053191 RepID=UPI00202B220C|nr:nucleoside diphosphate kinase 3 isoform X4 [Stegostoma tigrinum]